MMPGLVPRVVTVGFRGRRPEVVEHGLPPLGVRGSGVWGCPPQNTAGKREGVRRTPTMMSGLAPRETLRASGVASASREDHYAPVRLFALRLATQPGERDSIVDNLPLERRHGAQLLRLAAL
jgi:hypothetical protein